MRSGQCAHPAWVRYRAIKIHLLLILLLLLLDQWALSAGTIEGKGGKWGWLGGQCHQYFTALELCTCIKNNIIIIKLIYLFLFSPLDQWALLNGTNPVEWRKGREVRTGQCRQRCLLHLSRAFYSDWSLEGEGGHLTSRMSSSLSEDGEKPPAPPVRLESTRWVTLTCFLCLFVINFET